jgi:hypothetical protein
MRSMRRFSALLLLAAALGAQGDDEPAPARLDKANEEAARNVVKTFAREGGHLTTRLKGLKKEDVIVVGGLFDFVQEILVAFRCPHTVIRPADLEHVSLEPAERKIVLLNCHLLDRKFPARQPDRPRPSEKEATARLGKVIEEAGLDGPTAPGKAIRERFKEVRFFAGSDYSEAGLKRLGAAVRKGAWLYSTDWAVLAVEKALPGTIRWTGRTTYEEVIEVKPSSAGKRHSLLKGVFDDTPKPRWWIETESYLFRVKGKHTRLIESRVLGARYHDNRNIVVLLEPGKGRALHALSHGYLQRGRSGDATAMQRLLANYLVEKSLANRRAELEAEEDR